ncbi:hypothetical protein VTO73DRAFT_3972 [Trametes versicolor]
MHSFMNRSAGFLLLSIVALAFAAPLELELAHIDDVFEVRDALNSPEGTLHPALTPRRTSKLESAIVANAAVHITSLSPHNGFDEDSPSRRPSVAVSDANPLGGVVNPASRPDEHVPSRFADSSSFSLPSKGALRRESGSDTARTDATVDRTTPAYPPLRTSRVWWHGAETAVFVALVLFCGAAIGWICENFRIDL